MPKATQRAALELLAEVAFAPDAFAVPPEVLRRMGPRHWDHWGYPGTYDGRLDPPYLAQLGARQARLLAGLTDPLRLAQMLDGERAYGPEAVLTLPELLDGLAETIWKEVWAASSARSISASRRGLQRAWFERMNYLVLAESEALPADARFELKLANGESYVAEKVWERDGEAGFQFTTPIDLQKFLTEDTAFPKRQIRLRTKLDGVLRCDGIVTPIIVHDLSQQGAQIECPMHLAMNQSVKLETDGLPMLMATVRWRGHPNYGVAFQTVFRMDELAKLSWALRPSASKKRGA